MFIPGNSHKMLSKMTTMHLPVDAYVPDLEDSVPLGSAKDEARTLVQQFIEQEWIPHFHKGGDASSSASSQLIPLLIPRVNATLGESVLYADLKAMVTRGTDAITFGKAESAHSVQLVSRMLSQIEQEKNLPQNSIKVIPWIETALGIVNAYTICSADRDRLVGVAFGADDYANDLGIMRDTKGQNVERELEYPRSVIAVAASAARVLSLDTPNVNFRDANSTIEESRAVKQLGFKGKFAIHPNQVPHLNDVFGISESEYAYAKKVVDAYELAASADGGQRGSTQVDGRMIDTPVYRTYAQMLARAEAMRARDRATLSSFVGAEC